MLNEMRDLDMPTGLHFDRDGLIPVIVQEETTNNVLMLAFMNEEALQRTLETGLVHFWSRSRQKLWQKGETSGHVQEVVSLYVNCEGNSLLLQVRQRGEAACHDGYRSCYYRQLNDAGAWEITQPRLFDPAEVYPHSASGNAPSPRSAGILPAHPTASAHLSPSEQPPSRSAGVLPAHRPANTNTRNANQSANTPPNLADQELSSRARGYLPHWEQKNATYFVTFRLADALPAQTLLAFEAERAALLKKQESTHELSSDEKQQLDQLLSERVQHYLDTGAGACHLANPAIAQIVAKALRHFNGTRYQLFCWCLMPNHVHVVLQPLENHKLSDILHAWKSFTAIEANRFLGRRGEFWQREYYDHLVRDEEDFRRVVEYTMNNPLKAQLENWQWMEGYTFPSETEAATRASLLPDRVHIDQPPSRQDAVATEDHTRSNESIAAQQELNQQDIGFGEAHSALADAFQHIYRAYEYLRDHDLEDVSGTSRRLRHPDLPWLRQRVAQELGELAGVLDGTHLHTDPAADTILEGRQVCYWLLMQAVAEHMTFEQVMPHIHLRAGFEAGKAVTEAAAELFMIEERALLDDLSAGLYLVGGACQHQGVSLLALAEAELADLRQKSYLPPEILS